jgi:hypothetical protein
LEQAVAPKKRGTALRISGAAYYFAGFSIVYRSSPNENADLQDLFPCGFIWPERFMDACHVFHLSGDLQLVWMKCCLFPSSCRIS